MVAPDVEVDLLHQRFIIVIISREQFLPDGTFLTLHIVVVVLTVREHVAQNVDGKIDVLLEANHVVDGEFSCRVRIQVAAAILHLSLEVKTTPPPRAFEVQMLEEVSLT